MSMATISGELTLARVPALLRELKALAAAGVIDLAGVTRVDSAGLALLLELTRRASVQDRSIEWRNAPPALASLATFFGVSGMLHLEATGTTP